MLRNVPKASIKDLPWECGLVFGCVVGLYPDNLREAWGAGKEWSVNIEAILFINLRIPATMSYSCLSSRVSWG